MSEARSGHAQVTGGSPEPAGAQAQVCPQVRLLGEAGWAGGALEGPLSRVHALVLLQRARVPKGLGAEAAGEWPLPGVHPPVRHQARPVRRRVGALVAPPAVLRLLRPGAHGVAAHRRRCGCCHALVGHARGVKLVLWAAAGQERQGGLSVIPCPVRTYCLRRQSDVSQASSVQVQPKHDRRQ